MMRTHLTRVIARLLCLCILYTVFAPARGEAGRAAASQVGSAASVTRRTPEDAVRAFLAAIDSGDTQAALALSAPAHFAADTAQTGTEAAGSGILSIADFTGGIVTFLSMLPSQETSRGTARRSRSGSAAQSTPAPAARGPLSVLAVSAHALLAEDRIGVHLRETATARGGLDRTERLALMTYEGQLLMSGFELLQLEGGGWVIESMRAPLAYIGTNGLVGPVTLSEYLRIVSAR